MRPFIFKTLRIVRNNKVKSALLLGGTFSIVSAPVYVYNAKLSPQIIGTAISRTSRAGWTVVKAASLFVINTRGREDDAAYMSRVHTSTAQMICDMCSVNGGLFIKIGQHIGSLDYLLPKEYVKVFKILHNEAPHSTLKSVKKVLTSELGVEIDQVFSEFDDVPLGCASLAQVHRAVIKKTGKEVAVKVQHSMVQEHSKIDTITIEFLAKLVDKVIPEFQFDWLIDAIKRNLPKELDFVQEGQNAEHLSMLFTDCEFLKVPKIFWDYTTRRVLTMEYCRGGKVDDLQYMKEQGIDKNVILGYLSKIFSQMIFVRGYIHCDPHPGNVLVQKDANGRTQVVLLDHGLYQTLTDEFRVSYCKLWQGLLKGDSEQIKKQSYKLGVGKHYGLFACMVASRTWEDITGSGMADANSELDVGRLQEQAKAQIPEISQVLNFVPRQLLLILKTNDLLRGIECTLLERNTQGVGTFLNMARYCIHALATHKLNKSKSMGKSIVIYYTYYVCLVKLKLLKMIYLISLTSIGQKFAAILPSKMSF